MLGGPALMLLVGVAASPASASATSAPSPTKILVVAVAGVTTAVEQSVRTETAARGFAVRSADETRASLSSARELGLDCGVDGGDGADACWRRVAALALDDAIIVINRSASGVTLRFLDARADVPARVVSGGEDGAALTATLFEPPAPVPAAVAAPTPPVAPVPAPAPAPATTDSLDVVTLGVVVGATSAGLALASGVSVVVIQQAVLEDANASGDTKATAYGAGLVLMGTTVVFAVGALLGVGMVVLGDGDAGDVNGKVES